tara:strand:+ start:5499 stop:5840 length:342 start_codon:yes stop_codon:yes gene_type:complete
MGECVTVDELMEVFEESDFIDPDSVEILFGYCSRDPNDAQVFVLFRVEDGLFEVRGFLDKKYGYRYVWDPVKTDFKRIRTDIERGKLGFDGRGLPTFAGPLLDLIYTIVEEDR